MYKFKNILFISLSLLLLLSGCKKTSENDKNNKKSKQILDNKILEDTKGDINSALSMPENNQKEKAEKTKKINQVLNKVKNQDELKDNDEYKKYSNKNVSDFTKDSWDEFQKALKEALAMPERTDEERRLKAEAIQRALDKLKLASTSDVLDSEKSKVNNKNPNDYTKESWEEYQKALKDVLSMPENTEEQRKAKIEALRKLEEKLQYKDSKKTLEEEKSKVNNKNPNDYTKESWEEYQKALKEILAMPENTEEQRKAKIEALRKLEEKLQYKDSKKTLEEEKSKVNNKNPNDYTKESWEEYQKALKDVLSMPENTEEKRKAKIEALRKLEEKLQYKDIKKTLEEEKSKVNNKNPNDYTKESWEEYQKALKDVLSMPENTEEQRKAKIEALRKLEEKLQYKDSKKTLEEEKSKVNNKNPNDYTKESWEEYQKALKDVLSMPENTEEQRKAKIEALRKLEEKLQYKDSKKTLEEEKSKVNNKNPNDYTKESWEEYQKALKEILAMPENTEEQRKAKIEALRKLEEKYKSTRTGKYDDKGSYEIEYSYKGDKINVNINYLSVVYNKTNETTGGEVPVDLVQYVSNSVVNIQNNYGSLAGTEIRDGIRQAFIKWNTQPDGKGKDFLPGTKVNITENLKLYPVFTNDEEVLRKVGQAGGIVFYDAGSRQPWGRYLEICNYDIATTEWGFSNIMIKGATNSDIGGGKQNTLDIINSDKDNEFSNIAAAFCNNYKVVYNGREFNDWYLPSKDELNMVYINLKRGRDINGKEYQPIINNQDYYWSSTQYDDRLAWLQYFNLGQQNKYYKRASNKVRAIRAF